MKNNRVAMAETYGLAAIGFTKGIFELIRNEATELLNHRQIDDAPSLGHIALVENPDELQKVA